MSTEAKSLRDIDQETNILITGNSRRQVMVIKSADEVKRTRVTQIRVIVMI